MVAVFTVCAGDKSLQLVPDEKPPGSVHDFALRLLAVFEPLYLRFCATVRPWVTAAFSAAATLTAPGKAVSVSTATGTICGESLGIDSDGALIIRKDDGFVERVLAGDLVYDASDPRRTKAARAEPEASCWTGRQQRSSIRAKTTRCCESGVGSGDREWAVFALLGTNRQTCVGTYVDAVNQRTTA